jgi:hypothetical protein
VLLKADVEVRELGGDGADRVRRAVLGAVVRHQHGHVLFADVVVRRQRAQQLRHVTGPVVGRDQEGE